MLDSLGFTLSADTINSFFARSGKKPQEDELTIEETMRCLKMEVVRPENEKKRINIGDVLDWGSSEMPSGANSLGSTAVGEVGFLMTAYSPARSGIIPTQKLASSNIVYHAELSQQLLSDVPRHTSPQQLHLTPEDYSGSGSGSGSGSSTE